MTELPKLTSSYTQDINLIESKQTLYSSIYSLKQVEQKSLKIYIKINLVNEIIQLSKSQIKIPIFFIF